MLGPKAKSFRAPQVEEFSDPTRVMRLLNEALQESTESFLSELGRVTQALQSAKVAKQSDVSRETLWRALSRQGNKKFNTLTAILKVLGLRVYIGLEEGRMSDAVAAAFPSIKEQHRDKQKACPSFVQADRDYLCLMTEQRSCDVPENSWEIGAEIFITSGEQIYAASGHYQGEDTSLS
jgi:probable addiction module antidote protein